MCSILLLSGGKPWSCCRKWVCSLPWQNPGAGLSFVLKRENKGRWEILPQDSSLPLVHSPAANRIAHIRADIASFFLLCNRSSSPPIHTDSWGRLDKDLVFAALVKKAPSSFAEEPSITNTSNPPTPAAPHSVACRILIPQPRMEPVPQEILQWKYRVLTTGLPGNSPFLTLSTAPNSVWVLRIGVKKS